MARDRSARARWPRRLAGVALLVAATVRPAASPATVVEQRARLPPAAECDDPIEGTWRGLSWYPNHRQWYQFTLEIRRQAPGGAELVGTIAAQFWDGVPEQSEPGAACTGQRVVIRETAAGTFTGDRIHFGGTAWQVGEVVCGEFSGGYVLDQFKGTLEPARHEFQSINDWTAAEDDEATVFRRIACPERVEPDAAPPRAPDVAPPPFQPKKASGGC